MDQTRIGGFISQKRRELNITQAQLAEQLGVSNKTVSKWETGRCMPDYSIIQPLCGALQITVAELMDGETAADRSVRTYDERQMLDLLRRTQELERQRAALWGVILTVLGIALMALHYNIGGSSFSDFLSGMLLGIGVGTTLVGIVITAYEMARSKQ